MRKRLRATCVVAPTFPEDLIFESGSSGFPGTVAPLARRASRAMFTVDDESNGDPWGDARPLVSELSQHDLMGVDSIVEVVQGRRLIILIIIQIRLIRIDKNTKNANNANNII